VVLIGRRRRGGGRGCLEREEMSGRIQREGWMGWDLKFVVGGGGCKEKKKDRGFADDFYSLCAGFIWLDDAP
jgi:hypothetical protein